MAGIQTLAQNNARVLAQLPGELAAADIDRIDLGGAAGEQHIGEAAGRSADVEADPTRGIDAEMIERMGELQPAARDPGVVLAPQPQRRVLRQQIARLLDAPLAAEDLAGQDHRRCPAAALDEAALDQQQVGALLHGGRRLTWRWKRKVSRIAVAARPRARPSQRPTAPRPKVKPRAAPALRPMTQ